MHPRTRTIGTIYSSSFWESEIFFLLAVRLWYYNLIFWFLISPTLHTFTNIITRDLYTLEGNFCDVFSHGTCNICRSTITMASKLVWRNNKLTYHYWYNNLTARPVSICINKSYCQHSVGEKRNLEMSWRHFRNINNTIRDLLLGKHHHLS